MNWWTEYCSNLYNFPLKTDPKILQGNQTAASNPTELIILREEVELFIYTQKGGKSPGDDNMPADLINHGREESVKALFMLCQKVWKSEKWFSEWL